MEPGVIGALSLGLLLGITHAFDLDHVAAVSALSRRGGSWKKGVAYSFRWSVGHGGVLILIGLLAIVLNIDLPAHIVSAAEGLVGVILIVAGALILLRYLVREPFGRSTRNRDFFTFDAPGHESPAVGRRAPLFVDALHGVAGSGPLLAMLAVTLYEPVLSFSYLVVFALGTLMGMVFFGQALSSSQRWLNVSAALSLSFTHIFLPINAIFCADIMEGWTRPN